MGEKKDKTEKIRSGKAESFGSFRVIHRNLKLLPLEFFRGNYEKARSIFIEFRVALLLYIAGYSDERYRTINRKLRDIFITLNNESEDMFRRKYQSLINEMVKQGLLVSQSEPNIEDNENVLHHVKQLMKLIGELHREFLSGFGFRRELYVAIDRVISIVDYYKHEDKRVMFLLSAFERSLKRTKNKIGIANPEERGPETWAFQEAYEEATQRYNDFIHSINNPVLRDIIYFQVYKETIGISDEKVVDELLVARMKKQLRESPEIFETVKLRVSDAIKELEAKEFGGGSAGDIAATSQK